MSRIDARKQFHVVLRLAPALLGMMQAAAAPEGGARSLLASVGPFTEAIGKVSDEDADYILDTLLGAVQRKIPGDRGWASVMSGSGFASGMMFEDIDLAAMMQLAFEAGRENLEGFFGALASFSPSAQPQA
ncbi:MAG: hypothetical protein JWQ97_288 [Phenylobacterium sp.]|nr:hypothetical protein [Phenylobacterium sp.]